MRVIILLKLLPIWLWTLFCIGLLCIGIIMIIPGLGLIILIDRIGP